MWWKHAMKEEEELYVRPQNFTHITCAVMLSSIHNNLWRWIGDGFCTRVYGSFSFVCTHSTEHSDRPIHADLTNAPSFPAACRLPFLLLKLIRSPPSHFPCVMWRACECLCVCVCCVCNSLVQWALASGAIRLAHPPPCSVHFKNENYYKLPLGCGFPKP